METPKEISVAEFEAEALTQVNDLFRTALRVVGNRSEAEDIVQETCLEAWKSFHRFEPGTNCRAWMFKIMFRVINRHRRRWFRFPTIDESEQVLEKSLVYAAPVPQHLSDEDVLAAFDKLPEQYREVVLLADVQDFSYKEIADTLGIPTGTVMSRLSRGRSLLRKHLAEYAMHCGIGRRSREILPPMRAGLSMAQTG